MILLYIGVVVFGMYGIGIFAVIAGCNLYCFRKRKKEMREYEI